jgi:IclR family pca regulon transcriptional regulator
VIDEGRSRQILVDVGDHGRAMADQELEHGVRSVAVPIRGPGGSILGAMNISAHAARVPLDRLRRTYLPLLQDAVGLIEADHSGRR